MTITSSIPTAVEPETTAAVAALEGASRFVGLTRTQGAAAFLRWATALGKHPTILLADALRLASDQARVMAGVSTVAADEGDRRFTDPAWDSAGWKRVAQAYLAWRSAVLESVDRLGLDDKSAARA